MDRMFSKIYCHHVTLSRISVGILLTVEGKLVAKFALSLNMARRLGLSTSLSTPSTDSFYSIIREDDLECFTNYAFGVLEGLTCSEDEYLLILRELRVYDLVDGILRFHGMVNHQNNTIQHELFDKFKAEVRKGFAG